MLHHDVGQAAVGRDLLEEVFERLQATGGGTDAYDGKGQLGAPLEISGRGY
jgi:hypothetical protein